ncbi:MAG: cysteine--tRNA ligase [Candidatus Sumerlaeia bacterium]|nr:cysteine--tRNA ligase [Candidatus Sumerlaeia bacterium]
MLKIYNTLTRKKEEFQPVAPPQVRFYNCGPTVYDYFHIGNARNFILADLIRRYLRYRGYKVKFVQNITDIDDKIIRRANEEGRTTAEVVAQYTHAFFEHIAALGIERADVIPRATEHIPQMIAFIQRLIANGMAYEAGGDVFFRVGRFEGYGKLSRKKIEDLREGERVEVDPRKENPLDFVLWKAAKPGEPKWDSPWGPGRPGWHIECSVMAMTHLGETIDIHSGGSDLVFPHHENEIAQSEAATGKPFARYWIHNAFLNIGGEKMSKSLGNFVTIDQVLAHYPPMVVRYFFLSAHYRKPMDYGPESLEESRRALAKLVGGIETIEKVLALTSPEGEKNDAPATPDHAAALEAIRNRFCECMDDDFNTPRALSVLFDTVSQLHEKRKQFDHPHDGTRMRAYARAAVALLRELGAVLGLDLTEKALGGGTEIPVEALLRVLAEALSQAQTSGAHELADFLADRIAGFGFTYSASAGWQSERPLPPNASGQLMDILIAVRNHARQEKKFAIADGIRAALGSLGIVLEDYRAGTLWRKE